MAKKQSPSTLLWFIRRKSYVPLCEIRRRFELEGEEGIFVDGDNGARLFVGLPTSAAHSIEKLWRQNKIGLELSAEFDSRVVVGVFPMSPIRDVDVVTQNGHQSLNGNHAGGTAPPAVAAPAPPKIIDMPDPVMPMDTEGAAAAAAAD